MGLFAKRRVSYGTCYVPPDYPPDWAGTVFNPGIAGRRTNAENEAFNPRVWPAAFQVPARGVGGTFTYGRGFAAPVFNNQLAGGSPGYMMTLPGLNKTPYGG